MLEGILAGIIDASLLRKAMQSCSGVDTHDVKGECIEVHGALVDVNAVNRTNAFKKLADESGGQITIIARIPSEWNPEKVLCGLTDASRAHPDANCLLLALRLGDRRGAGGR